MKCGTCGREFSDDCPACAEREPILAAMSEKLEAQKTLLEKYERALEWYAYEPHWYGGDVSSDTSRDRGAIARLAIGQLGKASQKCLGNCDSQDAT